MMTVKYPLLISAVLASIAPMPVFAQDTSDRAVEQYTCKDIVRENDSSRETAIAFLHGYFLGKSGGTKFNLEVLAKQTDAFLDRCLDNPKDKAVNVMMKVKQ